MVRPKKHLGQHFLRDENIARKIISFLPQEPANIIEIGAGTGALSKFLLMEKKWNTRFFEIDRESISFLKTTWPEMQDRIIEEDFLTYDLEKFPSPSFVIGNFPFVVMISDL